MIERFGHYEIEELLGVGGMGEVYRARDIRRGREVALKLLPELFSTDGEFLARFRRESLVAARLREPHIVPIHDFGDIDGRLFIDMRLVDGTDLGTLVHKTGPLAPERAVALIAQVAEALDAAHAERLVHRDIKPSNVLVTEHDFVYVVDFGIARSIGSTRATALTITGATVGTLDYMAPERFTNEPIDGRADVYSLACVLFECLTAERPFPGDDLPALMYAHLYTDSKRPSDVIDGIPPALDDVIARGMAKDRDHRYATAGEFAAAARVAVAKADAVASTAKAGPTVILDDGPLLPPTPPARGGQPTAAGSRRSWRRRVVLPAAVLGIAAASVFVTTLVHDPMDHMPMSSDSTTTSMSPTGSAAPMDHHDHNGSGTGTSTPAVPAAPEDIPAGATPGFIQTAPNGRFAYICNRTAGVISVLDTADNAIVDTIPIPQGPPQYVSFTPDSKVALVSVFADDGQVNEIVFVDTRTNKPFDEVHVAAKPFASAVAPDGKTLWVPSHDENLVYVIDVATGDLIQKVEVAPNPHWVTFSPDGGTAWTANHKTNRITAIDTKTYQTHEVAVGSAPHSLEVSPDGTRVAVVDFESNDVTIVDTATDAVVGTVAVGTNPQDIAWAHDGHRLYTVNNADNSVSVVDVDSLSVVDRMPVDSPTSISLSKDGDTGYVTSLNTGTVRVLDLAA